jgi:hypothetical protein
MANFFDSTYDPRHDSGSSGVEVSDLHPEKIYDTDLRRLEDDEQSVIEPTNDKQERVAKFMRAAKTAGAYRQRAGIAEPTIRGKTPRNPAFIDGTELPSLGDTIGTAGSTNYANKPQPRFGKSFA